MSDLTPGQQEIYEKLKQEFLAELNAEMGKATFPSLEEFIKRYTANTDTAGYFEWQGSAGQYSREYRNGDLAEIDATREIGEWNWRYSDSAGKIIDTGTCPTLDRAKYMCDDYNDKFTGKGSN